VDNRPIGVFDSGVGGLTVARAIMDQLPHESITYLGDTAHTPYGTKSIQEVRNLALTALDALVATGVKVLVIACNSASAAVLRDARERYQVGLGVPVVEVIQPAARRAASTTRSGRVGVIGTTATISSLAYQDAFAAAPEISLFAKACPEFVSLVEAGVTSGKRVAEAAHRYLGELKEAQIDTLILGCTHYPLLAGAISLEMGSGVNLVSSAEETALDVFRVLSELQLLASENSIPQHRFVATGDPASFERLARRFLGPEVTAVSGLSLTSSATEVA
jgi:glutamate racemase